MANQCWFLVYGETQHRDLTDAEQMGDKVGPVFH